MFKCNVGNDQMDFVRKAKRCNRVHQSIKRAPIWYLNKLSLKMYNIVYPSIMMPINNKRPPPAPVTATAVCPRPPQHGSRRCRHAGKPPFLGFPARKIIWHGAKNNFLAKTEITWGYIYYGGRYGVSFHDLV